MHLLRPLRGAHVHLVFMHEQVFALDQLNAHLAGQKRVFEIGAVIRARRHHHDHRVGDVVRGGFAQRIEQQLRIMLDRRDGAVGKQLREQAHHGLAVFQHVRYARRRTQIVFQHVKIIFGDAHQINPGNMRVHLIGQIQPLHFRTVQAVTEHLLRRDDARLEDFLIVINVMQKGVERLHPLFEATLEALPLLRAEHARHNIKRNQAFTTGFFAVHRKGDAEATE